MLVLALYPMYVMWPVLIQRTHSHLGDGLTDVDGAIQNATMLKHVGLAFSGTQGFTAYPIGENFWRIETISQAISIFFYWLTTFIVEPVIAVNTFILIGWVLSGLLVFLLSRLVGASTMVAILSAVCFQVLPSVREQASNYTSYVWTAVPLSLIYMYLKTEQRAAWRKKSFYALILMIAFFDAYWFFFSIFILVICISYELTHRHVPTNKKLFRTAWIPIFFAYLASQIFVLTKAFSYIFSKFSSSGTSRPISIADLETLSDSSVRLSDLINYPHNHLLANIYQFRSGSTLYVGILTIVFALWALFIGRRNHQIIILSLLAAGLFLISLPPTFNLASLTLHLPSYYVRNMMPGVQYMARAALIAQAILLILSGVGITKIINDVKKERFRSIASVVLLAICLIDVGIFSSNQYSNSEEQLRAIKEVLQNTNNPVVVALPHRKVGRGWHEQWILNVPFVNGTIENGILADVDRSAAAGPGSLASFLASKEITHVLAPRDYKMTTHSVLGQRNFKLQSPRFIEVGRANTWGYENGLIELVLYKVSPFLGDQPCSECLGYSQIITPPNMVRDGEQPYFWSTYMGGTLSAHIGGPLGIWKIQDRPQLVEITFGTLTTQVLEVTDGVQKIKLRIPAGAIRTVQLKQDQARGISINPLKKCYSPQEMNPEVNDTRPLCFRIDSVRINLVEENHFELENR